MPDATPTSPMRARVIAAQPLTFPFLVYLRDKALLFNEARTAFVMYGVQGRTWVALGDPVGPEDRSRRPDPAVPRALRRLRRRAGLLRGRQGASAPLRRLRADVREARRGGEGRSDAVHARRRAGRQVSAGAAAAGEGGRRHFASSPPAEVRSVMRAAAGGVRRLARGKVERREGLLAGILRRGLRRPVSGGRDRARRTNRRRSPTSGRAPTARSCPSISCAITATRPKRDGGAVRAPDAVGARAGVSPVRAGHGAAVGLRGFAGGVAVEPARRVPVRARRSHLQLPGPPRVQGEVQSHWEPHYLAYPGGLRLPRIMADVSALVAGGYRQIFRK